MIIENLTVGSGIRFIPPTLPYSYEDIVTGIRNNNITVIENVSLPNGINPEAIIVSEDGTKAFAMNDQEIVYEYDLSVPFMISSASYNNVTTTLTEVGGTGRGMFISPDGTKLYGISTSDVTHQYTMSTPWDLSSLTYDSKSFSTVSYDSSSAGVYLSNTGSKLYVIGDTTDTIYQFSLGTPFDVSSAVYDNVSLNVGSLLSESSPDGLGFNRDGTKFYVYGSGVDILREFELTTPYDISTGNLTNYIIDYKDLLSQRGIYIHPTQRYMYFTNGNKVMVVQLGDGNLEHYGIDTFQITTNTGDSPYSMTLSHDQTKLFRSSSGVFEMYTLANAGSLSSVTLSNSYSYASITANTTAFRSLYFNTDGTTAIIISSNPGSRVNQLTLGTPYDFSNVIGDGFVSLTNTSTNSLLPGLNIGYLNNYGAGHVSHDGTRIYLVLSDTLTGRGYVLQELNMSTPWDISTITIGSNCSLSGIGLAGHSDVQSMFVNEDGGTFYFYDRIGDALYKSYFCKDRNNKWNLSKGLEYYSNSYATAEFDTGSSTMDAQLYSNIIIHMGQQEEVKFLRYR